MKRKTFLSKILLPIFIVSFVSLAIGFSLVYATGSGGLRILGLGILDNTASSTLSIDPNNRLLVSSTGSTTLSWANGNVILIAGQDIRPDADSTTAINIAQADGTDFVTFDTTNKRVGIGTTVPGAKLHIQGDLLLSVGSLDLSPNGAIIQYVQSGVNYGKLTDYVTVFSGRSTISYTNRGWAFVNADDDSAAATIGADGAGYFAGNVGIGTTAPGQRLHVVSSATNIAGLVVTGGSSVGYGTPNAYSGQILLGDNAGAQGRLSYENSANGHLFIENTYNNDAGNIYFRTKAGAVNAVTILGSGNVGIGTTGPSSLLEISKNGNLAFTITSADGNGIPAINFKQGSTTKASIEAGVVTDNRLDFSVNGYSRMMTLSNGNVGIGTTGPGYKLDIAGNSTYLGYEAGNRFDAINIRQSNTYSDGTGLQTDMGSIHWGSSAWNKGRISVINDPSNRAYATDMVFSTNYGNAQITDITERMRITSTGNVGIGTTSPGSKLHLYATALSQPLIKVDAFVTGGNRVDDVFVVNGEGNVGVRKAVPTYSLDVAGSLRVTYGLAGIDITNGVTILSAGPGSGNDVKIKAFSAGGNNQTLLRAISSSTGSPVLVLAPDASSGNVGIGTTVPGEKLEVNGNIQLTADNNLLKFGAGEDASITYDGTNMLINPKEVGSGILDVAGVLQTDGYNSSDGTAGLTATKVFLDGDGVTTNTVTIKDGLITAWTQI